ncbi:MAG: ribonuclease HII [Bacteroidetes bacterium]|nr:ribonuclease HII [Bacteroidota bacterium]
MLIHSFIEGVLEAGCDEAGRGCLAGPVVAASVILPENFDHKLLNDSKLLSEKQRFELEPFILNSALCFGVGIVDEREIEEINILNASFLAMHRAIGNLKLEPVHLIIDGNRFKNYKNIPHSCIIKGDSKFKSIAAASILAKNYRDRIMNELDLNFPEYDWKRNKGYPTKAHRQAIIKHGVTPHHRKTFNLLGSSSQLELF